LARDPVGSKIKEAREPTGLSAFDFSKIARIPFTRYAQIEAGKVTATHEEAWQIAEALASDPDAADPTVFYSDRAEDRYRTHSPISSSTSHAEQQQMFARDQDRARQTQLRQWLRSATASDLRANKETVQELRALDIKLDGRSTIDDSWAKALGVEEPAAKSVAEHKQQAAR
jgi:transcriptional regulator with XRE-family HTH domain